MGVHFGPAGLARLDDNKRIENETAVVNASRETGEDVHKSRTLDIAIFHVRCWGQSRRSGGMSLTSLISQKRKFVTPAEEAVYRMVASSSAPYLTETPTSCQRCSIGVIPIKTKWAIS